MEDSKNFPEFELTDSTSSPNKLTATAVKNNGFTITSSNWNSLTGELKMEVNSKVVYSWKEADKVTIGDLIDKLELYTHMYFNCFYIL